MYQVIEEKLNKIINQLVLDKTADVLDSAIDVKELNKLYLQSLLDPEQFEFAGEKWLHEIKGKLKDFQSTESVLPQVEENEIESKKPQTLSTASPSMNLKSLVLKYVKLQEVALYLQTLLGFHDITLGNEKKITFDAEVALNNPNVEHITLQNNWIKKILSDIGGISQNSNIPIIKFKTANETSGYWYLWQITAQNKLKTKTHYQPFFISDKGKFIFGLCKRYME